MLPDVILRLKTGVKDSEQGIGHQMSREKREERES